ncbi:PiggyBac transposable element-derived protein 3 [Trichinella pseudospiralis]|uniref:PiggyBac transposable element-derived protein 3 n=1 Tax=Trichinella pseudospiralis TaxID=6337 RepID=A0A0V1FSZ6_TRIPS|nr:PiggyBac transposable element-derived protein 3 [Trichinella pseudospiralis]
MFSAVLYFPCEAVHRRRNGALLQASQLQNTLIRGKPIRFGYKIWTLSSANGYPYALKIYAGRDEREKSEPLGMKVIEKMISVLERPEKHELYFNNFFASYNLLEKLSGKMIRATGIMRNSRTRKIPIMPVDEMACRCQCNHLTHPPTGSVQRYSQSQKKHVKIRMPEIARRYNTSMGGVDILDELLSSYRPPWQLHRELHQDSSTARSHLDFRRDVTTHLLRAKPRLTIRTGRRAHPPETLQITEKHYLESISQGRCRVYKKNPVLIIRVIESSSKVAAPKLPSQSCQDHNVIYSALTNCLPGYSKNSFSQLGILQVKFSPFLSGHLNFSLTVSA